MCLTLLGGGGGSRPSQTMSDFWPDLFLETAPYKPGRGPQEGLAKGSNELVDEHTARVNADLQALLRINSGKGPKGTNKVGIIFCCPATP